MRTLRRAGAAHLRDGETSTVPTPIHDWTVECRRERYTFHVRLVHSTDPNERRHLPAAKFRTPEDADREIARLQEYVVNPSAPELQISAVWPWV